MKTKLLKRLRKQIVIQERNGLYRVFDNKNYSGGINKRTGWIDFNFALKLRREWILIEAKAYFKPKKILTF